MGLRPSWVQIPPPAPLPSEQLVSRFVLNPDYWDSTTASMAGRCTVVTELENSIKKRIVGFRSLTVRAIPTA